MKWVPSGCSLLDSFICLYIPSIPLAHRTEWDVLKFGYSQYWTFRTNFNQLFQVFGKLGGPRFLLSLTEKYCLSSLYHSVLWFVFIFVATILLKMCSREFHTRWANFNENSSKLKWIGWCEQICSNCMHVNHDLLTHNV